jgi:hypothetical protein
MNIFMKLILSEVVVAEGTALHGIPAGFLVTAITEIIAFCALNLVLLVLSCTRWHYRPKPLTSLREWIAIVFLSFSFSVNIGLNNASLSLLVLSLNLMIRACHPLVTLVVQFVLGRCWSKEQLPQESFLRVAIMIAGVLCAVVATVAKSQASHGDAESQRLIRGATMCALSTFGQATELVFASLLGTRLSLNAVDTTYYMALPAACFLLPLGFIMPHPVPWPSHDPMTDWQVFKNVLVASPCLMFLPMLGGVFALGFGVIQYSIVQELSPSHVAFAGNFNKAATISLSLLLGIELLPGGTWGVIMACAIVVNIAMFAWYSSLKKEEITEDVKAPLEVKDC